MIINSIFIIDDDPIVVFGIKKLLHQHKNQMQVLTFNNGEDAINAIYKLNKKQISLPEVIFLDLNMPIMDGWEF
jgi:CheY-like chemotaxis protein